MKKPDYSGWATDDLAAEFERVCVAMYEHGELSEIAGYRIQYKNMDAVTRELRSRPGDQRRVLLRYLTSRNLHVVNMAAHATLTIDRSRARRAFEAVMATRWLPYSADAEMALEGLDNGTYKPE
jgi:hypothetical protein